MCIYTCIPTCIYVTILFMTVCTCIGHDPGADLEIIEIKTKAEIFSGEAGFSDETGIDDEISSEIQELTAEESHKVSTFVHTHAHVHTHITVCL